MTPQRRCARVAGSIAVRRENGAEIRHMADDDKPNGNGS